MLINYYNSYSNSNKLRMSTSEGEFEKHQELSMQRGNLQNLNNNETCMG